MKRGREGNEITGDTDWEEGRKGVKGEHEEEEKACGESMGRSVMGVEITKHIPTK